ncbi:hypothetical protein SBA1_550110 [Candidatus Sulfotelmatobacter kueseliae]|uniref:Uncharacterized protein n=1 Tax=Candidatus Sulfotelmatobacter kueseliae TaxID=2042962 RepID=A0A2U3KYK7_9BACT|nr:hypothetical protein SBA1_550110 [Candidatus Sulfotelmatobacter kueseliae]
MNTTDLHNPVYISTLLRDTATKVLNGTLTLEEAIKVSELPQEWIEAKINDETFEPPKPERKKKTVLDELREKPPVPRDVLTAEEKQLKNGFIDKLQKRRLFHVHVQCLREAAREVQAGWLTERAACEKYDVTEEDLQARIKDPNYTPERPLPPGHKLSAHDQEQEDKKKGGILSRIGF